MGGNEGSPSIQDQSGKAESGQNDGTWFRNHKVQIGDETRPGGRSQRGGHPGVRIQGEDLTAIPVADKQDAISGTNTESTVEVGERHTTPDERAGRGVEALQDWTDGSRAETGANQVQSSNGSERDAAEKLARRTHQSSHSIRWINRIEASRCYVTEFIRDREQCSGAGLYGEIRDGNRATGRGCHGSDIRQDRPGVAQLQKVAGAMLPGSRRERNASQSACVNGAVRFDAQTRETRKPTRAECRHGSRGLIDDNKVAIGRHGGGGVAAVYSIHDDASVQRDGSEDQTEDKRGRIHSAYDDRSGPHCQDHFSAFFGRNRLWIGGSDLRSGAAEARDRCREASQGRLMRVA